MAWRLLWLLLFLLPFDAWATNPFEGARAAAMGTAFVAIADDPSAVVHNPAGLTSLTGTHSYGGGSVINLSTSFENPQGQTEQTRFRLYFPPYMFLSTDFGLEDLAFGFGLYSPFGIGGRTWSEDGLTRYVSIQSQIATLAVNPTIAWRPIRELSVAAGFDYVYAFGKAKHKIDQSALGASDGSFEFSANGGGVGFNLGVLYSISEQVSLGVSYRSRVTAPQHGTVKLGDIAPPLQPVFGASDFRSDAKTTLRFPDDVSFGAAYRPTETWTLGFEVEWQDWSRFAKQTLNIEREVPAAGFTTVSTDLGWGSMWYIKLGMEHTLSKQWSLRAGYVLVITPVPDRTLAPDNPESNQHNLAVGIGYKFGRFTLDAFYNLGLYVGRSVTNSILSGKYSNLSNSIGLSIGYRFGEGNNGSAREDKNDRGPGAGDRQRGNGQ